MSEAATVPEKSVPDRPKEPEGEAGAAPDPEADRPTGGLPARDTVLAGAPTEGATEASVLAPPAGTIEVPAVELAKADSPSEPVVPEGDRITSDQENPRPAGDGIDSALALGVEDAEMVEISP